MTEHAIKIKEKYFKAVLSGEKTFEIRKNDRDYQVGDIIHFVPVDDECGMIIPHDPNAYRITYVFHGGEYGLEEGYCVFGIIPETHDKEIRAKFIDEAIETSAKAICIGCGYLDGYKCTYKGGNCGVSKPMLEVVVKALEQLKGGGVEC